MSEPNRQQRRAAQRRRGRDDSREKNQPHLAILLEHRKFGQQVHAGIARNGTGVPLCNDVMLLHVFALPEQDPQFALSQRDGWRHRYAEAFLEQNRGCPRCLHVLAAIGKEAGWDTPKELAV